MHAEKARKLVIVGASGHARTVADVAVRNGFEIVGFIDDLETKVDATFLGKPILGGRAVLPKLAADGLENAFVAIGKAQVRAELAALVRQCGLSAPILLHPQSVIAGDVRIGNGTLVSAGAIVNPNVTIGEYAIVNTGAIVEHDCTVLDLAHVCPGAVLAGGVEVGEGAWIGAGATVLERRRIGAYSIVGAGGVVIEDIEPNQKVVGVPTQPSRRRRSL